MINTEFRVWLFTKYFSSIIIYFNFIPIISFLFLYLNFLSYSHFYKNFIIKSTNFLLWLFSVILFYQKMLYVWLFRALKHCLQNKSSKVSRPLHTRTKVSSWFCIKSSTQIILFNFYHKHLKDVLASCLTGRTPF